MEQSTEGAPRTARSHGKAKQLGVGDCCGLPLGGRARVVHDFCALSENIRSRARECRDENALCIGDNPRVICLRPPMPGRRSRVVTIQPRTTVIDTRAAKPPPKEAASIYATTEYRHWRDTVISRAGGACQWPGCGRVERRMFADHIKEIQDSGEPFDPANGQCLCGSHHTHKTAVERARRMGAAPL